MKNVLLVEQDLLIRKLMELFITSCGDDCLLPALDASSPAGECWTEHRTDLILMDVHTAINATGLKVLKKW